MRRRSRDRRKGRAGRERGREGTQIGLVHTRFPKMNVNIMYCKRALTETPKGTGNRK